MRVSLRGNEIAKLIGGSANVGTGVFDLKPLRLLQAGCPKEISASRENAASNLPMVVTKNRNKFGYVRATDYWPEAIVVAGAARRASLLARGDLSAMAWVERGAFEAPSNDEFTCAELCDKLSTAVHSEIYGSQPVVGNQPVPYVMAAYPFESILIYALGNRRFRQAYKLDPQTRTVSLSGASVKLDINACGPGMPALQNGEHTVSNRPMLSDNQVSNRGAMTSDLMTQVVRNFSNVNEAVAMMLEAIKFGLYKPMQPSFYPVPLTPDGKLVAPFVRASISPVDMVRWAASEERSPDFKSVGGVQVHRKDFAYVGSAKDKSTWHLPIHDSKHVKNAAARVNQTDGIPASMKPGVLQKIRSKASTMGIDMKQTPKQKSWVKSAA